MRAIAFGAGASAAAARPVRSARISFGMENNKQWRSLRQAGLLDGPAPSDVPLMDWRLCQVEQMCVRYVVDVFAFMGAGWLAFGDAAVRPLPQIISHRY